MKPDTEYVFPTSAAQGMTLRDYFAAKAMSVLNYHNILENMGTEPECNYAIENCAALSYRLADAMLKAR